MFIQLISVIFLCSLFTTKHVFAIDCHNVKNDNFASTICSSNNLVHLDQELNDVYQSLLNKYDKKQLIDSQREWIKFVYASTCNNHQSYPSCIKTDSQYNPQHIERMYKHRIKFLKIYEPSVSKFNKIWYTVGGTAHNMVFDGSIDCDTHTVGLDSCDIGQSRFDEYTKYNDDCIFEHRAKGFSAYCVIDNTLMVKFDTYIKHDEPDMTEKDIQNTMYDLYEHAKWYNVHETGDGKPYPIIKSKFFKDACTGIYGIPDYCSLGQTNYYSRFKEES